MRLEPSYFLVHTLRFVIEEFSDNASQDKNLQFTPSELHAYCLNFTVKFITFVDNVLLRHKRFSIRKFRLSVNLVSYQCANRVADNIKIWLLVALLKQAEEIELYYAFHKKYNNVSILPDFKSQYLVKLLLRHCKIEPQLQVDLGSLKKLSLHNCTVSDEAFKRFISGCPSLQELSIHDPFELKKLSFTAPNIDKLSFSVAKAAQNEIPLLLDCPNVKTLDLVIDRRLPKVLDVTSVCHVNVMYFSYRLLNDEDKYVDDKDDECTNFEKFVGKFEATEVF